MQVSGDREQWVSTYVSTTVRRDTKPTKQSVKEFIPSAAEGSEATDSD